MSDVDDIAERHSEFEGYKLVDYGAVALPYYVLYASAVVVERKELPPVTEFLFRTVKLGLRNPRDIAGFLGIDGQFTSRLIHKLTEDSYLVQQPDGDLLLAAKGEEVLEKMHEDNPEEREIRFLWDLLQKRPSGFVETLKRLGDVERDHELVIRAYPMRAPTVDEIPVHLVQKSLPQTGKRDWKGEVIRLRSVTRRVLRWRPAVGLIYAPEKGKDLRVKFAVDGRIDDALSNAFAAQNGPERMGLIDEFSSRAAISTIRQRLKEVAGVQQERQHQGALIGRRAVLRWNMRGIESRLVEEESPALRSALKEKEAQLADVEAQLKALPVREILPFEIPILLKESLKSAQKRIIITTTRPSARRMDRETIGLLQAAADRRIQIIVLIADKKAAVDIDGEYEARDPLLDLSKIVSTSSNVQVGFLMEYRRPIYEIACDDTFLVAANDSPLGRRPREKTFTPFAGILLSAKKDIRAYIDTFLKDSDTLAAESSIRVPPQRLGRRRQIDRPPRRR